MEIIDSYLRGVSRAVATLPSSRISLAVEALFACWTRGGTTFIIGNGGSAATASHMMNDLTKLTRVEGQPPFKAMALTDNMPLITAWANDVDFESAFLEPLRTFLAPNDVVIAISTSGNSPNILRATAYARAQGATVIAFTGRTGGRLKEHADLCICVPSDDIGQQEDAHMVLAHITAYAIRALMMAQVGASTGNVSTAVR